MDIRFLTLAMTSRKSSSWMQVVSDWIPKWPRKQGKGHENVTGLDEEVQFNRIPDKYGIGQSQSIRTISQPM